MSRETKSQFLFYEIKQSFENSPDLKLQLQIRIDLQLQCKGFSVVAMLKEKSNKRQFF